MAEKNLNSNSFKEIEGVLVKNSLRAKRMSMSFNIKLNDIVLVKPKRVSEKIVREFIQAHSKWISEKRVKYYNEAVFVDGGKLEIYGREYYIERRDGRGVSCFEKNKIIVYCKEEFIPRRIKDFLKNIAAERVREHLHKKIEFIGKKKMPEIKMADPKTRWGSCKSDGKIMFSWRLIFMPVEVFDYVVAHEVAHLVHMDHSGFFWSLCRSLTFDADAAKNWIRSNGATIMGYR